MKTVGTLIIMNDWEEIFLNHSKDEINNAIDEAISIKRNYITIDYLNRDIYFNYIKDKKTKIRYPALEQPKQEPRELSNKERKQFEEIKKDFLKKTFEWRKKNFIEKRKKILEELAKDEERFWMQSTIKKLEEYKILKNKDLINNK